MDPYRIIVTGARDWPESEARFVDYALGSLIARTVGTFGSIVIVHGDCPTGVDAIADRHALHSPYGGRVTVEAHPARWSEHGNAAGPKRNAEMVALGADVCLAFPGPGSRGTIDCLTKAVQAGIATQVFPLAYARDRRVPPSGLMVP